MQGHGTSSSHCGTPPQASKHHHIAITITHSRLRPAFRSPSRPPASSTRLRPCSSCMARQQHYYPHHHLSPPPGGLPISCSHSCLSCCLTSSPAVWFWWPIFGAFLFHISLISYVSIWDPLRNGDCKPTWSPHSRLDVCDGANPLAAWYRSTCPPLFSVECRQGCVECRGLWDQARNARVRVGCCLRVVLRCIAINNVLIFVLNSYLEGSRSFLAHSKHSKHHSSAACCEGR